MVIRILVSRHSAFYSPLISTIAAGFLEREGYQATYGGLPAGKTSRELIRAGEVDVVQSAVSSNFAAIDKGETDLPVHFAQINIRDGFFLVSRSGDPLDWKGLHGRTLLADHAGQPLAMLKYAVKYNCADWSAIHVVDRGDPDSMVEAFRSGEGDLVHLQSPAAHQLEHDGVGRVVLSVGASMPEVAFSSLSASQQFVDSAKGLAFLRAYRHARQWVRETPPAEVARIEAGYFPGIAPDALTAAIAAYQKLGCWQGRVEIPQALYDQARRVFGREI
jgi:NitT/TauT family transport system substrate-binding protein